MTRDARMMSGIILITVPTIQYGGYFLLTSLMNKSSSVNFIETSAARRSFPLDFLQAPSGPHS
jgi:hypothetical protein